jgi:hypothetical protein
MLVHVTRSKFPDRLEDYLEQIENDKMTNFEMLLKGRSFYGWSLPKSAMENHPVWFQVTATSNQNALKLLKEAEAAGNKTAVRRIKALLPEIERCAGSVVAVGRVTGRPFRSTPVDSHFMQAFYAPVGDVTPLDVPVLTTSGSQLSSLAVFAHSAAQKTNRLVGGNEQYNKMLADIRKAGNTIPDWATGLDLSVAKGDWMAVANDLECSWIQESQLAEQFAIPLCRELADSRRVYREVIIRPDTVSGRGRNRADALFVIDETPLPVEFKLDRTLETDLKKQLLQYTGPAVAIHKMKTRQKSWRTEHSFVLVIDRRSVDLYENGELLVGKEAVGLRCGEISKKSIKKFKEQLLESLNE